MTLDGQVLAIALLALSLEIIRSQSRRKTASTAGAFRGANDTHV
jgi:hypothetical protein